MSRKLIRLALAASVAAGFGLAPLTAAEASTSGVDVAGTQFGNGKPTEILKGDTIRWYIKDGKHTITPDSTRTQPKWEGSKELEAPAEFEVTFDKVGWYYYKCDIHDMHGEINVKDPAPPPPPVETTTTTTAPPATQPPATQPPPTTTTTSAPASSQGTKSPTGGPAPTTTTVKDKDKKNKDDKKDDKEEETTTTTVAPPPPVDIPDSAIIPVLPGLGGSELSQNGSVELPADTPEGDAIALLKKKNNGGKAVKLLIISGLGLGALGIGTAGYKYANRSSKYFPA